MHISFRSDETIVRTYRTHILQLHCSPSYLLFRFYFSHSNVIHELFTKLRRRFLIKRYATIRFEEPTKKIITSGQFIIIIFFSRYIINVFKTLFD